MKLNKNQVEVVEWLKHVRVNKEDTAFTAIDHLLHEIRYGWNMTLFEAWRELDANQEFEVLQAFAEWGLKK